MLFWRAHDWFFVALKQIELKYHSFDEKKGDGGDAEQLNVSRKRALLVNRFLPVLRSLDELLRKDSALPRRNCKSGSG